MVTGGAISFWTTRLIAYVHLNPVRAGLVEQKDGLESYQWSSLPDYVKAPSKRRSWVSGQRGLGQLEYSDTVAGRRRHLEWLEGCVNWSDPKLAGDDLPEGQSLQTTFRRGWYFGSDLFREELLGVIEGKGKSVSEKRRAGYSGEQTRDHGEREAKRIATLSQAELGIGDWTELKKGDWRKGLVALLIRKRSLVDNAWLARRLSMGARTAVSGIMGQTRQRLQSDRKARSLARRLEKVIAQE